MGWIHVGSLVLVGEPVVVGVMAAGGTVAFRGRSAGVRGRKRC